MRTIAMDAARGTGGSITPEPAPLLRRAAAFALDQTIVSVYLATLVGVVLAVHAVGGGPLVESAFHDPFRAQAAGLFFLTLPVVAYFSLWEGSGFQGTPGKRLLGLHVTDLEGAPLPLERATLRAVTKFVPWEVAHTVLWRLPGWPGSVEPLPPGAAVGLAVVWIMVGAYLVQLARRPARRAPYDLAAGSIVVQQARRAPSVSRDDPRACMGEPGALPFSTEPDPERRPVSGSGSPSFR